MELPGYTIVLDASCPTTQVALFRDGMLDQIGQKATPAMQSLLQLVAETTHTSGIKLSDIKQFGYCAGPGSILGIRLSIMAIKTWATLYAIPKERIFSFYSLAVAAAEHVRSCEPTNETPFVICSEWKKNHWNALSGHTDQWSGNDKIEVWNTEQLNGFKGDKRLLRQRKIWSTSGSDLKKTAYSLATLEDRNIRDKLLRPVDQWEVYTPDDKQYATWSGERHKGSS